MKLFLSKLISWLPFAFLVFVLIDMFFLEKYLFRTRYAVLLTPSLIGLTISYVIATLRIAMGRERVKGVTYIYAWYIAIPITILLLLLTLASMNR